MYPALSQLEDEGLVRGEERDGRRSFALTDAGRTYVEERREELGVPWEEMSGSVDDEVSSLFGELRQVAFATAQIGQMGADRQLGAARKVLGEARRALYAILAEDETAEAEEA
jgi:DNA-binding PadR family transcriptional regulator